MTPAGVRQRYAAWSLDAALVAAAAIATGWPWLAPAARTFTGAFSVLLQRAADALFVALVAGSPPGAIVQQALQDPRLLDAARIAQAALVQLAWPFLLAFVLLSFAWHVAWSASPWQATPGKRSFGLRIEALDGTRLPLARAAGRHLAAGLSWATLNVGHLMAMGPARMALHDRLAGTRVVAGAAAATRGARVTTWLWLQVLAAVAAAVAAHRWAAALALDAVPA